MKSIFKVGSRANVHLTSDKRIFGEIVSATDEFVEVREKRRDRPVPSTVYINYSNITCVYPEEEVAQAAETAPVDDLKVGTPATPGGGESGPLPTIQHS
jgi:hypothetical protein